MGQPGKFRAQLRFEAGPRLTKSRLLDVTPGALVGYATRACLILECAGDSATPSSSSPSRDSAVERASPPSRKEHGSWDGVCWAFSTMTTVGYGDISPDTTTGKVLAVVLMFIGIGFVAIRGSAREAGKALSTTKAAQWADERGGVRSTCVCRRR